ncbi:hypothetical protein [Robbsia sp. KACC 23696]|uniref:hypothetical protein n=1 Tax=Robbsia sp. KACC 23696 TaxID=3149231 RepID=UPI00325BFE8B
MRVDIAGSRCMRWGRGSVIALGTAAWAQIGVLRGGSVGGWLAGLMFLALVACLLALAPHRQRRHYTRLVLLGHADARLYWRAAPLWRWQNARLRLLAGCRRHGAHKEGLSVPEASKAGPAADGVDEVCIVEMVQWGGLCLWLTVCPRYPGGQSAAHAAPGGRRSRTEEGGAPARFCLCLPADTMTPERFHALCARCQAMRRGAGFLSPW